MVFKRSIAVAGAASNDKLQVVFAPDVQDDAFRALRRDQKFFVRVMTTSTAYPYGTFAWRAEEEEYFSQEYPIGDFMSATTGLPLAVTGTDGYNTGVYVYFDKQKSNTDDFTTTPGEIEAGDLYEFTLYYNEGDNFDASDSNTAHQLIECSGRGICDYNSGKCACLGGYTGEACQRTVCPSSCSGHGSCSSQLRFATDGLAGNAAGYTSYEKEQQYGCKCDKGYRGPDCSQGECHPAHYPASSLSRIASRPSPSFDLLTLARSSLPLSLSLCLRSGVPLRRGPHGRRGWRGGPRLLRPRSVRLRHWCVQVLQGLLRRAMRESDHPGVSLQRLQRLQRLQQPQQPSQCYATGVIFIRA